MLWYVIYGRIMVENDSVKLEGVYFGGFRHAKEDADEVAKACTNTIKGGTIIPRLFKSERPGLQEVMDEATDHFLDIETKMVESHSIMMRRRKRNKPEIKTIQADHD